MATGVHKTKWDGELLVAEVTDSFAEVGTGVKLDYQGKLPADSVLLTPPAKVVKVWAGTSDRNRLYFGDNLTVLASLLKDPTVSGQVKLIYIDPPFSTDKVFKSRKQAEAYSDTLVGGHYVEFLRRRLILLRELMAEDGSIYVHLDHNMVFYIKIVMDEIFGSRNLRGFITRKKCNPKNYTRRTYGNVSDHILYYSKTSSPIWNRPYVAWEEERAQEEYPYVESETRRRYKKVPIHAPGTRNGATGRPWRGMNPPPGKHWQYLPEKLDAMDARGEIYWSPTGNPRRKVYWDQNQGVAVQDIWLDVKDAHNQMIRITGYPTEKPTALVKRIVEASSNEGDLVLDCFAGSGTSLAVASQLDRQWIGVDNSSEAITTILHRFSHGLEPMGDFVTRQAETSDADLLPLFQFANIAENQEDETVRSKIDVVIDDFSLYSVDTLSELLRENLGLD